jgi:membrane protein DedA with SNARE-associated domain
MPDSPTVAEAPAGDDEPGIEVPEDASPVRSHPSRRVVTLITIPLIAMTIISYVGDAIMPQLVDKHPLLLMAMNPRNRNLLLVVNQLDAVSYYVVGTLRLLATDPLWFLIGYWYGESALRWAEKRTRTFGDTLRWFERGFSKAAYPLILIAPNNWICLFAGAAGMRVGVFFALNIVGTVGRLYLIRVLGETFQTPIDWVLDFIRDYRMPLLGLSIVTVLVLVFLEYRKGDSEIGALSELDDQIGGDRPAPGPGPGSGDKS